MMATESTSHIQVPYKDNVSERGGLLTNPWAELFKAIKRFIDSRATSFISAVSDNFLLSTSGYVAGEWAKVTGNKITLTPGEWVLSGQVFTSITSSSSTILAMSCQWSIANGDNTSSVPSAVPTQAGLPKGNESFSGVTILSSSGFLTLNSPRVRVSVTKNTDIYLVPSCAFSTAGDGYLKTYIYAERIKSIPGVAL